MTADVPVAIPTVDWDTIYEEILCPLCDYNLRGLIRPRCPECGYRFDWPALLDPARRRHPYLFEHHPEGNLRSFVKTALGGMRPRRFWQSLHPAQPSHLRRLIAYWFVIACAVLLLTSGSAITSRALDIRRDSGVNRAFFRAMLRRPGGARYVQQINRQYGSVRAYLDGLYPDKLHVILLRLVSTPQVFLDFAGPVATLLAWPWLTFAALMVFQISMRRAKIKAIHVLRCTVYTSDILFWFGLAIGALLGLGMALSAGLPGSLIPFRIPLDDEVILISCMIFFVFVFLPIVFYRLTIAYKHYLRFDHPFLTVLASQVIVALVFLNLAVVPILWR